MPDLPAVDFLAPQGSHLKRYSYSGFEENSEVGNFRTFLYPTSVARPYPHAAR